MSKRLIVLSASALALSLATATAIAEPGEEDAGGALLRGTLVALNDRASETDETVKVPQDASSTAIKPAAPGDSGTGSQEAVRGGAATTSEALKPQAPAFAIAGLSDRAEGVIRGRDAQAVAEREALAAFYGARQDAPVWVDRNGLAPRGQAVLAELRAADSWGLEADKLDIPSQAAITASASDDALADLELGIAASVLRYAHHARGGRVDPADLSYDIDMQRTFVPPAEVLEASAAANDVRAYLQELHPASEQFRLLRAAYLKLTQPAAEAALPTIDKAAFKAADQQAEAAGHPALPRPNFEKRAKGEPSSAEKAEQIARNMEMWRWLPRDLGKTYVLNNIPSFTTRLYENGKVTWQERIIVGKPQNQTAVFSDEMDHIVFRPLWHLPASIKVKDLLPGLLKGGDPISRRGLRVKLGGRDVNPRSVDWGKVDIRGAHVYQPSGDGNALGDMKFMFPNKHAIYMHDTPTKALFEKRVRTFSHGCVRTRNPMDFAVNVLRIGNGWSREKVLATFRASPEDHKVDLGRKIPVHIVYFTAWANPANGAIVTYDDVYKHERHIRYALAGDYGKIVKVKQNVAADYQRIRASVISEREPPKPFWFSGGGSYSSGGGSSDHRTWSRDPFRARD